MKLKLYHYWRSSSSWRVRWALTIKNIPYAVEAIDLLSDASEGEAHILRNPLGYVPVMEIKDNRRPSLFLSESTAIIEWLEERHPTPSLFHGDAFYRARTRQLAQIINAGIQPIQNPNVVDFHTSDPEEKKRWNKHWITRGLQAYETLVKETAGKFSVGDTITVADLFLIPQCYNARRQDVSLALFPTIEKIDLAASQLESYKTSRPEKFKPGS